MPSFKHAVNEASIRCRIRCFSRFILARVQVRAGGNMAAEWSWLGPRSHGTSTHAQ
jgi:hypothetical protein